jgi:ABC-type uncharacterized transport system permease subunit
MLAGMLCGVVYFTLAVAVAAFAASWVRSTIGAVGVALGILLLMPIVSVVRPIANWLPSALVNAPVHLVNETESLAHFVPALVVSLVATVVALLTSGRLLARREI